MKYFGVFFVNMYKYIYLFVWLHSIMSLTTYENEIVMVKR